MLNKSTLSIVTAVAIAASIAGVTTASAASHHQRQRTWQSQELVNRPVALPYGYSSQTEGPYSGAFRTDSAPITGGGY
jgi:hypothetical protein